MPKVSVLTPIYKTNIRYLCEMVESVLSQTFTDYEFLILNDSPNDKELDVIIREYQQKDSRIRYIKNSINLGISESRNRLLRESSGEYLAILDHDDICLPERFKKQVEYLDENPNVGVVGTWAGIIGKGRSLHFPVENIQIKYSLMHECVISHSSSMIRKSALVENGILWESKYSPSEDYMLWAKLFPHVLFHNIPEELLKWRINENSSGAKSREMMADRAELVRSYLAKEYPSFLEKSKWYMFLGVIPIIKKNQRGSSDIRYLLGGVIPIMRIKW